MTSVSMIPEPPMSDELATLLRRLCDGADLPFEAALGARRAERLSPPCWSTRCACGCCRPTPTDRT